MTQVLEQKNKKKKQWEKIIDAAKEKLKKNDNTKKDIIINTAKLLESKGMPLEMTCGDISRVS
jgi:excinuclease UvrABC nuclease subunit